MEFKTWLNEAMMRFGDIADAIKKTLEFVVTDGTWQFDPKTYGLSGIKTVSVAGHFIGEKGHFFLSAHTVAEQPIDSYDTKTGQVDANTHIEIIASICVVNGKNGFGGLNLQKIGERSNTDGGRLRTPYQLALWVKSVIDNYGRPDDGDDDGGYDPTPTPVSSNSKLVSV